MIKTANERVKKHPEMVIISYGLNKKFARFVIMAGYEALKRGIDSSEIANKTASLLGGGGSGRSGFAQGGGKLINEVPAALKKAEETIKEQLKRRK